MISYRTFHEVKQLDGVARGLMERGVDVAVFCEDVTHAVRKARYKGYDAPSVSAYVVREAAKHLGNARLITELRRPARRQAPDPQHAQMWADITRPAQQPARQPAPQAGASPAGQTQGPTFWQRLFGGGQQAPAQNAAPAAQQPPQGGRWNDAGGFQKTMDRYGKMAGGKNVEASYNQALLLLHQLQQVVNGLPGPNGQPMNVRNLVDVANFIAKAKQANVGVGRGGQGGQGGTGPGGGQVTDPENAQLQPLDKNPATPAGAAVPGAQKKPAGPGGLQYGANVPLYPHLDNLTAEGQAGPFKFRWTKENDKAPGRAVYIDGPNAGKVVRGVDFTAAKQAALAANDAHNKSVDAEETTPQSDQQRRQGRADAARARIAARNQPATTGVPTTDTPAPAGV